MGDLSTQNAYEVIDAGSLLFNGSLIIDNPAEIELRNQHSKIELEYKFGLRI